MELRKYFRALGKYWWIAFLAIVLCTGASVALTDRIAPEYQSSVTFFVSTPSDAAGTALQADQYATRRINSYIELLGSDELAKRIISRTHVDLSVDQVRSAIVGSTPQNTVILTATVTDTSPSRSLIIAGAIADDFGRMVDSLDNRGTSQAATVTLQVTSGPTLNPIRVSPRWTLNVGIGLLLGIVLGALLVFLLEQLDTSFRTVELLRSFTGRPVLGTINLDRNARRSPIVGENAPKRSIRAEAFRSLRTNLQFVNVDNPVEVLVVSSSVAGEGKSTSAVNLAIMFAEAGRSVVLVEGDLRRPRVADYLGLERAVGLTNVLAGRADLDDVLQQWGSYNLAVLPSGSIPPNPSELLGSRSMAELMGTLRVRFDLIVVDSPPLLPVTDAAVVSAHADGVIVIVRYGRTTRAQLAAALGSLKSVDAKVLGTVLNMRPARGRSRGYDGFGYYEDDPSVAPPLAMIAKPARSPEVLKDAAATEIVETRTDGV